MKYNIFLFFDTETTGLPQYYKAPISDLNNWPRLVQISWICCDNLGTELSRANHIIEPIGFTIPQNATDVHGISTEKAKEEGEDLNTILKTFSVAINHADFLIAHNMSFDEKIVGAEFLRTNIPNELFKKPRLCTMKLSTDFCKLPGKFGYKWPSLSELYDILFSADIEGAHDASVDVAICAKCFYKLKSKKIIDEPMVEDRGV